MAAIRYISTCIGSPFGTIDWILSLVSSMHVNMEHPYVLTLLVKTYLGIVFLSVS